MDGDRAHDARRGIPVSDANSDALNDDGEQARILDLQHLQHLQQLQHLAGRVLGGCHLVRLLSAGGMGEVYLAEQIRLGNRLVAVKVVRPQDAEAPVSSAVPSMEARFMHEARLLGHFSHPNILPVHDSGFEDGYLYLVMQYTPDGSLADAIRGTAPHRLNLPVRLHLAVDIVEQIASALQYTHDHGIVHRDVKPANVLVQRESNGHRRMLLADFGIARGIEATAQWNQVTGTVTYMAPEQFSGAFFPASDQYGLAVITYLLLGGRPPFTGDVAEVTRGHILDAPPPLRSFNPNVPLAVEQVIARALSKYPNERFSSVSDFAQALRQAATEDVTVRDMTDSGALLPTMSGTPAGATLSQAATRPTRSAETQPADGLLFNLNQNPPRPAASVRTLPPIWQTSADDVAQVAVIATSQRRDRGRRALVFAITAVLLAVAAVAAIQLGPTYISHGFSLPGQTRVNVAPTTPLPSPSLNTPTSVEPTASPDKVGLVTLSVPQRVAPRQRFDVNFTLANTGTSAWSNASGYRLICDTLNHPQNYCPVGLALDVGNRTIAPGQRAQFTFTLIAPSRTGTYTAWVNMARNGALFSTPDVMVRFTVQVPPPAPTPTTRPRPTPTIKPRPTPTTKPRPTATPSPAPTATPSPPAPTATPLPVPTDTPNPAPTDTPAPVPTATTAPAGISPPATATTP